MKILVLGADGFIGRHICFTLRAEGHAVIACARRTGALERMGFATLRADLADPASHAPGFWRPHLADDACLVNAAGLLTGPEPAFRAVHVDAPRAAYAARAPGAGAVLISAVGVEADTPFARWRRQGETVAAEAGVTILRPGLVLADTSYGGSSLLRALAAMPLRTPLVGSGTETTNPIHAADLARVVLDCLTTAPGPGAWQIGGPETVTQAELIAAHRSWLGLPPVPVLHLPATLARLAGRLGDLLALGPISTTALRQLETSLFADGSPLLDRIPSRPRAISAFLHARPAGTQDLWQARLYLLKPLIRLTLALLWLVSGLLGLALPAQSFLPLFAGTGLPEPLLIALARAGGALDLALAAALLGNWRPRAIALAQLALVGGYTLALTVLAPGLWLAPFGELLKNLPVLALILTHLALAEER